jgi:1,4-alpha-glucan branching enzyme
MEIENIMSAFDKAAFDKKPKAFSLHNNGPRHKKVEVCGSFDDWETRHDLNFDPFTNQWFITLHLKTGEEYFYKYIINEEQWIVNDQEP